MAGQRSRACRGFPACCSRGRCVRLTSCEVACNVYQESVPGAVWLSKLFPGTGVAATLGQ